MMHSLRLRALAAITSGLVLIATAAAAGPAEKGKAAYVKHGCWQCHGFDGPMPLEGLKAFVRNSNGAMPPYQKAILPDEDLADIYAYLKSMPKGPDPKSIPLLNP